MKITNFQFETKEAGYNVRCKTDLLTGNEEYFMVGLIPEPLPLPGGKVTVVLKEQEFPLQSVTSYDQVIPAIEKLIQQATEEFNKPKLITPNSGGLSLVN